MLQLWRMLTWVLLAMEMYDVGTGLQFDTERIPKNSDKYKRLHKACVLRRVLVIVEDPEPYTYLVYTSRTTGEKFRTIRGVIIDRAAIDEQRKEYQHNGHQTKSVSSL